MPYKSVCSIRRRRNKRSPTGNPPRPLPGGCWLREHPPRFVLEYIVRLYETRSRKRPRKTIERYTSCAKVQNNSKIHSFLVLYPLTTIFAPHIIILISYLLFSFLLSTTRPFSHNYYYYYFNYFYYYYYYYFYRSVLCVLKPLFYLYLLSKT